MSTAINEDVISLGQYIVIQRQNYTKLHKFSSATSSASLGKDHVELGNILGSKFFTTFKMIPKGKSKQRIYQLEVADNIKSDLKNDLKIQESGCDNRNIIDDGKSQKLTAEEIGSLRDTSLSSTNIVETLISNSNTFHSKTEYSQEKYLKKKQKKYFEFVTIRKPSIRLISDIMYRQDPSKVLGLRPDTLSQLLSGSNINSSSNCLLYDSGSAGLLSAAILNLIGENTEGNLVHVHPGNSAQKQAILAMNYTKEQLDRCTSVNIYSVLRHFYQNSSGNDIQINDDCDPIKNDEEVPVNKRKRKSSESNDDYSCKLKKCDNLTEIDSTIEECDEKNIETISRKTPPIWMLENEKACTILKNKVDSFVIASKEHPMSIFKAFLQFVHPGKPFVVFNQYQEPLQECFIEMRKMINVAGVKLTQSWLRGHQVLPDRTHPEVLMQGNSGFLLSGWIVQ